MNISNAAYFSKANVISSNIYFFLSISGRHGSSFITYERKFERFQDMLLTMFSGITHKWNINLPMNCKMAQGQWHLHHFCIMRSCICRGIFHPFWDHKSLWQGHFSSFPSRTITLVFYFFSHGCLFQGVLLQMWCFFSTWSGYKAHFQDRKGGHN